MCIFVGMENLFYDYRTFMKSHFRERVQKISVHAGFTCPNRDGTKGTGGCTFCNNRSFSPDYCLDNEDIRKQIDIGMSFFSHKPDYKQFIVYFQSYSNTYGDFEQVKASYEIALSHPNVVGISIGTRPDCVNDELLNYLGELSKKYFILLEFGVESTYDSTLKAINRGHTYKDSINAIIKAKSYNIITAAHLIIGLPGENEAMILENAKRISMLPIDLLKIHQLQIIKDTPLAEAYVQKAADFNLFSREEYLNICIKFVELLRPNICIERFISQSNLDLKLAPSWEMKNFQFVDWLKKQMKEKETYQGRLYNLK